MTTVAEPKTEDQKPPATPPATPPAAPPAPPPADSKAPENKAPDANANKDGKGDDKTILGGDGKTPEKAEGKGAPEKYTDFTLPEGQTMDKTLMEKATAEFKALGLSQEAAQKLVTLQAESAKSYADNIQAGFDAQVKEWKETTMKHFGAKAPEEIAVAAQAINRFGTPELRQVLNDSGLGNHPELVKMLVQIGHAIKEENPADGKKVTEQKSDADVFYPGMKGGKK